ncbi:MAG: flavin reductase family protein [Alphaproteobacteria bacterium]|nr:flavin reductase family protein [Alphaproteobacteria bacterium]
MFYDAIRNDHGLEVDPFKALVVPRPIGWISTLSTEGVANLAPYSFFNAMSQDPHYVVFGSGPRKDSLRNIEATGEFAVNLATFDLRDQMNASSATVAPYVDEFDLARLTKAPCRMIKAPRVAESPACLECRLFKVIDLPDEQGRANDHLAIGRVIGVHIDDRFIETGRVNTAAMRPIARLGYSEYATVTEAWRMRRPS